jgi:hypothetical protein
MSEEREQLKAGSDVCISLVTVFASLKVRLTSGPVTGGWILSPSDRLAPCNVKFFIR